MKPEGSLPCSQEPATGPYPEQLEFSPQLAALSEMFHTKWSLC